MRATSAHPWRDVQKAELISGAWPQRGRDKWELTHVVHRKLGTGQPRRVRCETCPVQRAT